MQLKEISKDIYDLDAWLDEGLGAEGTPQKCKVDTGRTCKTYWCRQRLYFKNRKRTDSSYSCYTLQNSGSNGNDRRITSFITITVSFYGVASNWCLNVLSCCKKYERMANTLLREVVLAVI